MTSSTPCIARHSRSSHPPEPVGRSIWRMSPTVCARDMAASRLAKGCFWHARLVEGGATLVTVNWHDDGRDVKSPFWDTHKDNFTTLKNVLMPPLDRALSGLLADLSERGLLETTLVVVMGEFGRTPRIGRVVMNSATNASGRDHWPHAYSVLLPGVGFAAVSCMAPRMSWRPMLRIAGSPLLILSRLYSTAWVSIRDSTSTIARVGPTCFRQASPSWTFYDGAAHQGNGCQSSWQHISSRSQARFAAFPCSR